MTIYFIDIDYDFFIDNIYIVKLLELFLLLL